MNRIKFFFLIMTLFVFCNTDGQVLPVRHLNSKFIGKDSVNIYFNDEYAMTDDSCASIVRFGHLDSVKGYFIGKFKDLSKQNPSLVLGTGSYTKDGRKSGEFVLYYPNGN